MFDLSPAAEVWVTVVLVNMTTTFFLFLKEGKGWGLGAEGAVEWRDGALRCGVLENTPQEKILLSQNVNADQMSLAFFSFFFFLHVSLNSWHEYQLKLFTTNTHFLFVSR